VAGRGRRLAHLPTAIDGWVRGDGRDRSIVRWAAHDEAVPVLPRLGSTTAAYDAATVPGRASPNRRS